MYKIYMLTKTYPKVVKAPHGDLIVPGKDKDQVFEDLDNFIKEVRTSYPKLKEIEFFVSGPFYALHKRKFTQWFRDDLMKEYEEKTGYKITWAKKNAYVITLKR